jgi:hypothetical protein
VKIKELAEQTIQQYQFSSNSLEAAQVRWAEIVLALHADAERLATACQESVLHFETEIADDQTMIDSDFGLAYKLSKEALDQHAKVVEKL